ncbi:MAG: LysR family transcriptional regulator [Clostridia bacterium]|nr:LysR family transcriptional regulator [Clostridia bacterium]
MELLQLKYFVELAKTEHVTRTAEALHVSQPSLSSTIKKLEEELGAPLFERAGRSVRLSSYGKTFFEYAKDALLCLERGEKAIASMKSARENTLRLGVLSPYVWSDLFAAFKESSPDVRLDRLSMEGDEYIDALLHGRIDVYLGSINGPRREGFICETLYTDDMVLEVNVKHKLAKRKSVDLRKLGGESFINLGKDKDLQKFISGLYKEAGIAPDAVMEVDYTLRDEMVSQNYGVSVTTRRSAEKAPFKNVTFLPLSFPRTRRALGLVRVENGALSPAAEKFCAFAEEYYK